MTADAERPISTSGHVLTLMEGKAEYFVETAVWLGGPSPGVALQVATSGVAGEEILGGDRLLPCAPWRP